jgi:uncharacterized membrane protein HdeD (DUF308 family)
MLVAILTAEERAMRIAAARRMVVLGLATFLFGLLVSFPYPQTAGLSILLGLLSVMGGITLQIQEFQGSDDS